MAVANTKSTLITNKDASPPKANDNRLDGGRVKCFRGFVEVAAADDNASVYRLARIHSSWLVDKIELLNDAITAGTQFDLGVYQTADNGGAAVDIDILGTLIDMSTARVVPLDATFEVLNIDQIEKRLWEVLGLTSDPNRSYDICLTGTTVGTAAGTIAFRIYATLGD